VNTNTIVIKNISNNTQTILSTNEIGINTLLKSKNKQINTDGSEKR
jgi:hypothetical protein